MAKDAPIQKVTVKVLGVDIVLDPENMRYNENMLGDYMNKEYGWIDYLGKQLEFAEKEVLIAEIDAEATQAIKFMESKDAGNTDNYAKAYSLAHVDVVEAKKWVVGRKETVGHLKAHLKAWHKNHENVQNRGHTLRKEMGVLHRDHYETTDRDNTCNAEDYLK